MNFALPHNKRYSPKQIEYPTPYVDVRLEPDYKSKTSLLCDLTYWAVEFLYLCDSADFCSIYGYDYELFRSAKHD
jgi:hypothetical protein